ncbi:MAG: hypothetical protein JWP32_1758 [Schumannella sp.]|nr:hypothetical protein [Schumannella sp.]
MFRICACTGFAIAGVMSLSACATYSSAAALREPSLSSAARPNAHPEDVAISTSSWQPGDSGRTASIRGPLTFTPEGCPQLGSLTGVVWPAGYTSIVKTDGQQVVVTADGQQIAASDTIITGGVGAGRDAGPGMPCIEEGTVLTVIESAVQVVPAS